MMKTYELILHMVVPYAVMFVAAYTATSLLMRGRLRSHFVPVKAKRMKPHIGVMDTILIIELIAIVIYVIADFWIFWHVGAEPSNLTLGFFAVCGGENGFMAWIKTRKEQERFREWQKQDEDKEYKKDTSL